MASSSGNCCFIAKFFYLLESSQAGVKWNWRTAGYTHGGRWWPKGNMSEDKRTRNYVNGMEDNA
ncbi:hypothetical protein E2C01_058072 [Portunus trituberculatus]|uniref:Uncharacterized protein n=1 Tax=Portunus trituberculatus TaxID=210409 RepID=A0A5B7H529_PORTR|nr:hypothetical protein [Portunus trituberculatus]